MEDNDSQNQHDLRSFSQPIALPVKVHKRQPTPTPFVTPIELQKQMDELQAQDPESPLIDNLIRDIDKAHKKLLGVDSFAYSKTEKLYQKDLELFERQIAADHPILASSFSKLAELYRAQGKYREAETPYLRLLKIAERRMDAYPYSIVDCLNNLALIYYSQGKYSEAEPLYLRSLEIWERVYGADHVFVSRTLNTLAGVYRSQGKYSEAEPLYLRSLAIFEVSLGNDHPNTKTIRDNLQTLRDKLTQTT
jgi:tetratricopeptide (TPR) repeat protein